MLSAESLVFFYIAVIITYAILRGRPNIVEMSQKPQD